MIFSNIELFKMIGFKLTRHIPRRIQQKIFQKMPKIKPAFPYAK